MPELRKDPVVGRWVIVAKERARRPGNFVDRTFGHSRVDVIDCPFCHSDEKPIYTLKHPQDSKSQVVVVPFRNSFLKTKDPYQRKTHGIYDVSNDFGVHEVVIETPEHIANMADLDVAQIQIVLRTYADRINELEKNKDFQYIIAFKNFGSFAGSRKIEHARSHIMATPVNPLGVKEKLTGAKDYFANHKHCIYCDLIQQEKESGERIVHETEHFFALSPFAARFLFETWIIPKQHHCDFAKGVAGVEGDLAQMLKTLLKKFQIGLDDPAYNYMIQTAPFRHKASGSRWQTIEQDFHWHIELMPRLTQIAGFEKGTGFYICAVPPENMAEFLREVQI